MAQIIYGFGHRGACRRDNDCWSIGTSRRRTGKVVVVHFTAFIGRDHHGVCGRRHPQDARRFRHAEMRRGRPIHDAIGEMLPRQPQPILVAFSRSSLRHVTPAFAQVSTEYFYQLPYNLPL
jgi:hypothetical protein